MALCDRLEAARSTREATRDRLTAASLARLNRPDPNPRTFRAHAAQTLEALAPLTTRPDQIKPLRQTILNLAVRGRLVPQDPTDEASPSYDRSFERGGDAPFEIPMTSFTRCARRPSGRSGPVCSIRNVRRRGHCARMSPANWIRNPVPSPSSRAWAANSPGGRQSGLPRPTKRRSSQQSSRRFSRVHPQPTKQLSVPNSCKRKSRCTTRPDRNRSRASRTAPGKASCACC